MPGEEFVPDDRRQRDRLGTPACLDHGHAERRATWRPVGRCELEHLDRGQLAGGCAERKLAQLDVDTQLAQPALAKGDPRIDAARAGEWPGDLGRQKRSEPRQLQPLDFEIDTTGQVARLGESPVELGFEADARPERLRQPGGTARDDSIAVAAQHDVEILQVQASPGFEVAHVHRGVRDLHVTGGQPVQIERGRSAGRSLNPSRRMLPSSRRITVTAGPTKLTRPATNSPARSTFQRSSATLPSRIASNGCRLSRSRMRRS